MNNFSLLIVKHFQVEDRMISLEEGQRRSKEIGCVCFHEISVRESIEQVRWRLINYTLQIAVEIINFN